jgi:hypothetical protein
MSALNSQLEEMGNRSDVVDQENNEGQMRLKQDQNGMLDADWLRPSSRESWALGPILSWHNCDSKIASNKSKRQFGVG